MDWLLKGKRDVVMVDGDSDMLIVMVDEVINT